MGLLKEGKISFPLWLNTNARKLFLMQPPYSKDLRRRAMCPGIAVTFEIRSTLAKRITFFQLICSLYPTNLLLSFRNTLSLHRHFLTATLSFIDRGCYLEKQRKKRGGRRTGKGGGAGRKKTKQIARQQSL